MTHASQSCKNLAVGGGDTISAAGSVADQVKVVFQGKVNKSFGRPQLILINLHPLFELWVLTSLQCHQIDFPSKPLVGTSVNNKSSSSRKTQG